MKAELQIERVIHGEVWGVIEVNGNMIVDSAESLEALKDKMTSLAWDLEKVSITEFEVRDITEKV